MCMYLCRRRDRKSEDFSLAEGFPRRREGKIALSRLRLGDTFLSVSFGFVRIRNEGQRTRNRVRGLVAGGLGL